MPPDNLILEIPFADGDTCPMQCQHCIHHSVPVSAYPKLKPEQIKEIIIQGKKLGVKWLNIYPHRGDMALLEHYEAFDEYLQCAHAQGLKVKSLTSAANPRGIEALLPGLDRLSVSVDALDWDTYRVFRSKKNYTGMLQTLDLFKAYKRERSDFYLTALVMVNLQTLPSIERRVAEIVDLGIFDKVKVLEMLPVGKAGALQAQALLSHASLNRLTALRHTYAQQGFRIGVPLWRIKNGQRGCRLGGKDLVVGPRGELAGCTLLFYLNGVVGNLHEISLEEAWLNNFQKYRQKENRPVMSFCRDCPFYQKDLCWGGCLARSMIFGQGAEIKRSCGIQSIEEAQRLYGSYEAYYQSTGKIPESVFASA